MTKNKKIMLTTATAALTLMCLARTSYANPTTLAGDIEFDSGSYTTDVGGNGTGTAPAKIIETVTGAKVSGGVNAPDGVFGSIPSGTAVTFNTPITFNPPTSRDPLWTVNSGGDTYEFVATTMGPPAYQAAGGGVATGSTKIANISLAGFGYVDVYPIGDGGIPADLIDVSTGTWSIGLNNNNTKLSFQAGATVEGVPDGGTTVSLLGGALLAIAALRRKMS